MLENTLLTPSIIQKSIEVYVKQNAHFTKWVLILLNLMIAQQTEMPFSVIFKREHHLEIR